MLFLRNILLKILLITGLFEIIGLPAVAKDKLQYGFERLDIYDYFKAREIFQKNIKSNPVPAYFGLSIICSRNNNPFFNLDSARSYVLRADSVFKRLTAEEELNIKIKYHITGVKITNRKDTIASIVFRATAKENTVPAWNKFIQLYSFTTLSDSATFIRNQLAYANAIKENTTNVWTDFIETYPHALQRAEAQQRYEDILFTEQTASGTVESYSLFITSYPQSPYRSRAEDSLFVLATKNKSPEEYYTFSKKYASNRNASLSWMKLYQRYTELNEIPSVDVFFNKYPDFPYKKRVKDDFSLANVTLLPVKKNNRFTFITESGKQAVTALYEDVDDFSEGLCAVSQNGKYGYINKTGKMEIGFQFEEAEPFENGYAPVKLLGKYSIINREGNFLFEEKYDEVGYPSDERILILDSGLYGYLDMQGKIIIKPVYEIAFDFVNGRAVAGDEEKLGVIDLSGRWVIQPQFSSVIIEENGIIKVERGEKTGLLGRFGEEILGIEYDEIGKFSGNLALIAIDEKHGYVSNYGRIEIPIIYDFDDRSLERCEFRDGFAEVMLKGKPLLINTYGDKIIRSIYEDLRFDKSNAPVAARKKGKWGFIDLENNVLVPFSYDYVYSFSESLASVKVNKLTGVIDSTGKMVIQPRYDFISPFRMGVAVIKKSEDFGLITKYGSLLIIPDFEKYKWVTDSILRFDRNNRYGYYNYHVHQWVWKEEGF